MGVSQSKSRLLWQESVTYSRSDIPCKIYEGSAEVYDF